MVALLGTQIYLVTVAHRLLAVVGPATVWLAASAPAVAQSPPTPQLVITGPATIAPYSLGQFVVTGDATAKVAWLVMPNTSQVTAGQSLIMTGRPGPYTIIAFAVVAGQPVILQQGVTIGSAPGPGPGPSPGPTPGPTPTPPVEPTTGPYFVLYVTDKTSSVPLTAGQQALKDSNTMPVSLKLLDGRNQWASADVSTLTIAKWLPEIQAAGMPCVLILGTRSNGSGYLVEPIPNPVDEASVLNEVKRLAAGGTPR